MVQVRRYLRPWMGKHRRELVAHFYRREVVDHCLCCTTSGESKLRGSFVTYMFTEVRDG